MNPTKRTLGLYSTGGCLAVAAVLALLNLVATQVYSRLDCTENKIYSLSPSTVNILRRPTDPVRIKVFFDETVPPEYLHNRRYLKELLDEMSNASMGKLRVEFVDMKQEASKEEAQKAGVSPLRFTALRKDKFEIQEGYMGLAIYYEDKKEVMGAVTQTESVEYDLAGRIVKLTQGKRPVVAWSSGSGEVDQPEALRQYLSQNYDVREVDLTRDGWRTAGSASPDEPPALSALVVPGPHRPLPDTALRAIDQAILAGVPTALLMDLHDVQSGNFFVRRNVSGLERLSHAYGVDPVEGLVVDAQNVPVQVQSQQGFFMVQSVVNYPYIPRVTDLSREHAVTRKIPELALPYVSALTVRDSSGVTVLARSSAESYRIARPFIVPPGEHVNIDNADSGPFVLGVSIQGVRHSAFADTVPPVQHAEGPVRVIVLTNSTFLDEARGAGPANMSFAANLVDWLTASEDMIAIRSKTNTYRPLEKVSDRRRNFIKVSDIFLMPLCVAAFGVIRWQYRRNRRRQFEPRASA